MNKVEFMGICTAAIKEKEQALLTTKESIWKSILDITPDKETVRSIDDIDSVSIHVVDKGMVVNDDRIEFINPIKLVIIAQTNVGEVAFPMELINDESDEHDALDISKNCEWRSPSLSGLSYAILETLAEMVEEDSVVVDEGYYIFPYEDYKIVE